MAGKGVAYDSYAANYRKELIMVAYDLGIATGSSAAITPIAALQEIGYLTKNRKKTKW